MENDTHNEPYLDPENPEFIEDGDILWIHAYPSALTPNLYEGGPSGTPTIADSNVYTFSKQGRAFCLDANDGTVRWQKDLVADYGVRIPRYGFAGATIGLIESLWE